MDANAERSASLERWLPICVALAAMYPLVAHWRQFSGLFWFGDELALMAELDRMSFWTWLGSSFAENFVPVFKLAWGGVLFLAHGSYPAMLLAAWLTHAFNVWLLARRMARVGFQLFGILLAACVFGLSASNIETLTWGVQWSSELSVTFFLLAAFEFLDAEEASRAGPWASVRMGLWSLAGAWSFSRGILIGPVVLCLAATAKGAIRWRLAAALASLIPSIATAYLVARLAPENHHEVLTNPGLWGKALAFFGWYLTLNPWLQLWANLVSNWSLASATAGLVPILGTAKLGIVVAGFYLARPRQRRLLAALLLFDVGYAALLGFGRSGGELYLACSSRYQYNSLVCTLPFVSVLVDAWLRNAHRWRPVQVALILLVTASGMWVAESGWGTRLPEWVDTRGLSTRRFLLQANPDPAGHDVWSIPYRNDFVKHLAAKYNLH